jgi:hypothetical protein
MKRLAILLLLFPALADAQTIERPRVFLTSHDEFANAFAAGVQKKGVPVTLTTDPAAADYTVDFNAAQNKGSKARGITTAIMTGVYADGAYDRVSMLVTDAKTKDVVYSYTCQKGGGRMQSVAECLAKHWKEHLQKK